MNERRQFTPDAIFQLGTVENAGNVVERDLEVRYRGRIYILSVGTQNYLDALRAYNQRFSPEEQLDENMLVMQTVNDLNLVIRTLRGMDFEAIAPYLVEQELED